MTSSSRSWFRTRPSRRQAQVQNRRRPALEGLEGRELLTLSVLKPLTLGPVALGNPSVQSSTTTTPSGPATPVTVGQSISATAVVGIPGGSPFKPTGTVTFFLDGVAVSPVSVLQPNGIATSTLPTAAAGNHTITASYSGDANFEPSQGSVTQVIGQAVTSTRVAPVSSPQRTNQSVFLSATVSLPNANVSGYPAFTGYVTFYDRGISIGNVQVGPSGFAQLVRPFSQGGHSITAAYSGSSNYLTSNSNFSPVNFTVIPSSGLPGAGVPGDTVVGVERRGYHWQPTTIIVKFSGPMDPAGVQNADNYTISGPNGVIIPVLSAVYDPATESVTLTPASRLNLHRPYLLVVNGKPPLGLTDAAGEPLDGAGAGFPGTDYVTTLLGFRGHPNYRPYWTRQPV